MERDCARVLGLKRYSTGKACQNGHVAERLVSDGRCVECCKEKRARLLEHREAEIKQYQAEYRRAYYQKNKARCIKLSASWKEKNREAVRANKSEWRAKNLVKERVRDAALRRKRYAESPAFRCSDLLRQYHKKVVRALKQGKSCPTSKALGYTARDFKRHIELQFLPKMEWANHGAWHIDHIVPISKLIEEGITDPAVINRLSNLRPIWARDNLEKGAKLTSLL